VDDLYIAIGKHYANSAFVIFRLNAKYRQS